VSINSKNINLIPGLTDLLNYKYQKPEEKSYSIVLDGMPPLITDSIAEIFNLRDLSDKVANARIEKSDELPVPSNDLTPGVNEDLPFASETMAKIFERQGALKSAIDMYEKLIVIYPDKATEYRNRISEIISIKPEK
jgi:hypothetical protein